MTLFGLVLVGARSPEGIANTSHQTRLVCWLGWQGCHVSGSFASRKHWRGSLSAFLSVTYFGTGTVLPLTSCPSSWPVWGSVRFSLGSKNSVSWNGLMWMWNG